MSKHSKLIFLCQGPNDASVKAFLRENQVSQLSLNQALIEAVKAGNINIVTTLLRYGADVAYGNESAICLAAQKGRTEICRLLVLSGANVNARDGYPLRTAYMNRNIDLVLMLVKEFEADTDCIYGPPIN